MALDWHVPSEDDGHSDTCSCERDRNPSLREWLAQVGSTVDVVGFVNPADVQVTGPDMVTGIRPNQTLAGRDPEDPFDMPEERG